jgi:hypothetical protein
LWRKLVSTDPDTGRPDYDYFIYPGPVDMSGRRVALLRYCLSTDHSIRDLGRKGRDDLGRVIYEIAQIAKISKAREESLLSDLEVSAAEGASDSAPGTPEQPTKKRRVFNSASKKSRSEANNHGRVRSLYEYGVRAQIGVVTMMTGFELDTTSVEPQVRE